MTRVRHDVFRVERDGLTRYERFIVPAWEWECDLPDLMGEPTSATLLGEEIRVARGDGGPLYGPILAFGSANGWWVTLQGLATDWRWDWTETPILFAAACKSNLGGLPDLWFRKADVIEAATPDDVLTLIRAVIVRREECVA